MDQQLEDSLNLVDEAMATDYDSSDNHEIIDTVVLEDKESHIASMEQLERSVELQKVEGHELMTEHEEIMADLTDITAPDMPILEVEDDLTESQPNKGLIKLEMISQPENIIPDTEMPLFVTIPPKSVHSTITNNSTVTRVTSGMKPLAIAPKPVAFLTTKSLPLPAKKSFTSLQSAQRSGTIVGVDSSGRQVLFQMTNVTKNRTNGPPPRTAIVSGGANGTPKLKLVAQAPQQLVVVADSNNKLPFVNKQTVVAKQPFINKTGQFTTTKKIVPAKGTNQVNLPKLNLQAINTSTSATAPKYLTLQQAQQLGLLTGTQGVKVQQMVQFADKPMQNFQVIRPTKSQTLIRSPTKILPALAPSQGGKIVLPTGNQTVVIRSATPKVSQVLKSASLGSIKLSAPLSSASLTNASGNTTTVLSGATLSAKTLQSLHVPGKFLRIVPANTGNTITNSMNVSATNVTNIAKIAPKPEATLSFGKSLSSSVGNQRTLVAVSGGKTMLLPEGLGGFVQVPANKLQTTLPVVSATATIKKIVTKPQQKLIPVSLSFASTLQKISTSSTVPISTITPALLTNLSLSSQAQESVMFAKENDNATITPIRTEENQEMEDSKASLLPIISAIKERKESGENDQEMETDDTYEDVPPDRPDSPDDESGDGADSSTMDDGVPGEINSSMQHLLMLPASFLQQIGNNHESLKALVSGGNIDINNIKEELLSQLEFPPGTKLPIPALDNAMDLGMRPRKPCNCAKSQCLKLYCDCFANGEFCHQCNCNNCFNNLENEEERQKAIKSCLERNPNAFRPKIGKAKLMGTVEAVIRRHNKGCNCKRSGCLKNYCECYEAKIACSANCKCVGCRNVEETVERSRNSNSSVHVMRSSIGGVGDDGSVVSAAMAARTVNVPFKPTAAAPPVHINRQPCSFMTSDVIDAVCQCLLAAASEGGADTHHGVASSLDTASSDPIRRVLEEYARCLQDIIGASRHAQPTGEAAA